MSSAADSFSLCFALFYFVLADGIWWCYLSTIRRVIVFIACVCVCVRVGFSADIRTHDLEYELFHLNQQMNQNQNRSIVVTLSLHH